MSGAPGAAVGGVVGAVIPEIAKLLDEYQHRAGEAAGQLVSWTADLTCSSAADLHIWAVGDDERLSLLAATIQAALSTLDRVKIRTLARVLAEAVEDDAKIDMAMLVVRTLGDLESPHVRVLKVMTTEPAPITSELGEPIEAGTWLLSTLQDRLPHLSNGLIPLMAALEQHGLVHGHGIYAAHPKPDPAWSVTSYGANVVAYLSQSAADLQPL